VPSRARAPLVPLLRVTRGQQRSLTSPVAEHQQVSISAGQALDRCRIFQAGAPVWSSSAEVARRAAGCRDRACQVRVMRRILSSPASMWILGWWRFSSGRLVAGQRERRRGEQHEEPSFGDDGPRGVAQVLVVDHDPEQHRYRLVQALIRVAVPAKAIPVATPSNAAARCRSGDLALPAHTPPPR
jgi:hypothetical protein